SSDLEALIRDRVIDRLSRFRILIGDLGTNGLDELRAALGPNHTIHYKRVRFASKGSYKKRNQNRVSRNGFHRASFNLFTEIGWLTVVFQKCLAARSSERHIKELEK